MNSSNFIRKFTMFGLIFAVCIRTGVSVCNIHLRHDLEDKCESTYNKIADVAQDIEDDTDREEAYCCALEDLEACNMKAYDISHCQSEKPTLKENLKAARLFLSVLSNVTCNELKKHCSSCSTVFLHPWCIAFLALSFLVTRIYT